MKRHQQKGAVIVTAALVLLFLLGFMGIALDFGRLFIVKTELQTAMDSCALAAAQELDGASDALPNPTGIGRAASAGMTAGNLNKVNFQGAVAGLVATDITFSNSLTGAYNHNFAPAANAKYAKCTHIKSDIAPWLLQSMRAFSGNDSYKASNSVFALGVATRVPAQRSCSLPVAVCQKSSTPTKPYGYSPGEWILGAVNPDDSVVNGQFRWVDYTGNGGGAREIKEMLAGEGQCNLPGVNTVIKSKTGNNNGASDAYNTRFGIYQGSYKGPADGTPDLTGYAWYAKDAASAVPLQGRYLDSSSKGFLPKRANFANYQGDDGPKPKGTDTVGLFTKGTIYSGSLAAVGASRRIVTAPVADCSLLNSSHDIKVNGIACLLLLHPLDKTGGGRSPPVNMWLEYIGTANDPASPCSSMGLAGGSGGPLVPTLVR